MKPNLHTTLADRLLIGTLVILAGTLFFVIPRWVVSGGTQAEIRCGDKLIGRYSLTRNQTVNVSGPLGNTVVRINNKNVRVLSSPCPYKQCVRMGPIGADGGVIACVPNKVVISVVNGERNDLDAVSR